MAGLIAVAWVVLLVTRRHLRPGDHDSSVTFSLEELRHMKAAGTLSEEEYERARDALSGHNPAQDRGKG